MVCDVVASVVVLLYTQTAIHISHIALVHKAMMLDVREH